MVGERGLHHARKTEGGEDCGSLGWIHAAGEAGDATVIPALRRLRARVKNYYVRLELLLALAKVGDRAALPDLLRARGGNLEHMRLIDGLLRWLSGTRQGDLDSAEDARVVFGRWEAWLKKNAANSRP